MDNFLNSDKASQNHIPVMLNEVLQAMAPEDGEIYIDATFGAGGYSRALLENKNCTVYGFDRDPKAIADARKWSGDYGDRLVLINEPFSNMKDALTRIGVEKVDGVVFDLGVSSMQLDESERGFSFRFDGPLSMRMDKGKPDAADIIAQASIDDLKMIFRVYGEEKRATLLARAIVREREKMPITSTKSLADIIEAASPSQYTKKKGRTIHPATRVFQALRIFVNDELGQLAKGLVAAEKLLRMGGRLVAVTFHSLEARIVKRFLTDRASIGPSGSRHLPMVERKPALFDLLFKGQQTAQEEELAHNPRARSAALRAARRTDIPALEEELDLSFASLPDLSFSKPITAMEII